jgi:hypothetical protein
MIKRGELIKIDTPYRPNCDSFARPSKFYSKNKVVISNWFDCREVWHLESANTNLFFFSYPRGKYKIIVEFMNIIENILDVQPRSFYGPTQRKTIMWVYASSWWIKRSMRRSLYTILLRVAKYYDPVLNNFNEVICGSDWLKCSTYAVFRFLDGYTKYTGNKSGWAGVFCDCSREKVDKLLIKP